MKPRIAQPWVFHGRLRAGYVVESGGLSPPMSDGVTQAELGCGGCPPSTGCLLWLSFCPPSLAAGTENFQKLPPGCISYGCRTFPDPFLHPFPCASLL